MDNNSKPIKLLLIGDSDVGKTSLLLQYTENFFPESHMATIGVEFKSKDITINGKAYKLHIWDTAGQERYKAITKNFYKHAQGIIFVYDVSVRETFLNLKNWMQTAKYEERDFKILIVGNKADKENDRQVTLDELIKLAKSKNCQYFETSAKKNINVETIFLSITESIIKDLKEVDDSNSNLSISLDKSKSKQHKTCC